MNIHEVKISEIKKNPNNPRTIKDEKFAKLVQSIREFPEMLRLRPIVVNDDMVVLGGNMRLKACKEAGLKVIPIIKASDLTEDQQRQFIIKDNVGFGEWDWEMLANEWDTDKLTEWGLDLPDMDAKVLDAEDDDFDVPDGGIDTDIVPGDLFEIGAHRLSCGDSTDADAVARLMNGEKADMVFTDPPYGYKYESNHYKNGNPFGMLKNDDQLIDFFPCLQLSTKENCGIYVCGSHQTIHKWREMIDMHFVYKNMIVWKKNNWSMGDLLGSYAGQHELILFAHKGKVKLNGRRDTDVWEFDRQKAQIHPTQKPLDLISFAINKTSELQNVVLDPFLGSGSTMVAAHQLGRKCYGMELDPKYCQVIVDRMRKLDPSLEIKRNGKLYK